jgi:large subunit ribosomal protein L15
VDYLQQLFTPLEFPEDVAQRMTTHVSWERGTEGHNGRLSFIGRRVLHTYLLLFLHECLLPSKTPQRPNTGAPSDLLRPSSLTVGGDAQPIPQTYEHISDKLLDTYVLGEHVGGAWHLERIMRWTPAVAQLDTLKATDPSKVLHGSGLYKVRGATVEGVMGGIFHQFVSICLSFNEIVYIAFAGWFCSTQSIPHTRFTIYIQIWFTPVDV